MGTIQRVGRIRNLMSRRASKRLLPLGSRWLVVNSVHERSTFERRLCNADFIKIVVLETPFKLSPYALSLLHRSVPLFRQVVRKY